MKLPTSSSLLLATLAISSSSSTLAAPSGEGDSAITTSSSNHHISAFSDIPDLGSADINIEQRASTTVERSEETRQETMLSAVLGLLQNVPIIGHSFASMFEKSFLNGTDSVAGMPDISPDDLKALQAAIAEVSRALSQGNQLASGVPSAVQTVSGTAPTGLSNGDGLMSNSFSSASTALADPLNNISSLSRPSAAAADGSTTVDRATSSQVPSEPASAPQLSSPTIPGNPPNSPVPLAV